MYRFDVMVIGAGSAGRYGAKVAALQGANVGLIETGPFGGLCILNGCMPTKAYLRSSELVGLIKKAPGLGVYPGGKTNLRFSQMKQRKDRLINEMAEHAKSGLMRDPNITLLSGAARFLSPTSLQVGKTEYACEKFLIASGSRVAIPAIPGLETSGYLSSDDALALEALPSSMAVLGGGAEAVEFGQFFHRMGVKITMIQRSRHLLSQEDADIGIALGDILRKDGIDLWTGTQIEKIEKSASLRRILFKHAEKIEQVEAEEILLVTGRTGNVEQLNLDGAGVATYYGGITVNEFLQTSNANIYAAGDVTGIHQVVNMATYQGKIAGENIMKGTVLKADYRVIPRAIFTDPQYARVGISEREAKDQAIPVQVGKFLFDDLGKAIVTDQMDGFIKVLAAPESGEILGVQILGAEASNLIHQGAIAMKYHATLQEYASISHIHPSLAEIMLYLVDEMIGAV